MINVKIKNKLLYKNIILNCTQYVIAVFLLINSSNLIAEEWHIDPDTDCAVLKIYPHGKDVEVNWTGECLDGKAEGDGRAEWFSYGNKYSHFEGSFKDGKPHGFGHWISYFDDPESYYKGEWYLGRREGKGVEAFSSFGGMKYEGHWVNNKKQGEFIITRSPKITERGIYENGVLNKILSSNACEAYKKNGYEIIKTVKYFSVMPVGAAASWPRHMEAYECLINEPDALEKLKLLLVESGKAGQMYALEGIYRFDDLYFHKTKSKYMTQDKIQDMAGCLVMVNYAKNIVYQINSGSITEQLDYYFNK